MKIFKLSCLLIAIVVGLGTRALAVPLIMNEELVSISDDMVIVTWRTTNEASVGGMKYGLTLPVSQTTVEAAASQYHYLILGGLAPNTVYFYQVFSSGTSATAESTVKSFKTLVRPTGNYLFTFASLTDLHYSDKANTSGIRGRPYGSSGAIIDALVAAINKFNPAFTIIKGDMIDDGATNPITRVTELKGKLDNLTAAAGLLKYYPIPGNHDKEQNYAPLANWVSGNLGVLYPPGAGLPTGSSTFNYSFTYGGYRFVMLDSVAADGVTCEVNLASLEAQLQLARAAKQKAFICMHHECSEEPDIPNDILAAVVDQPTFTAADWDKIRISNSAGFFNLLQNYRLGNGDPVVAGVFMGHIHDNMSRTFYGIPCTRTASGLQFPTGFDIYKVYSNGIVQTFYKLPGYSEELARDLITGTGEVTATRAQQFYLGGLSFRNFTNTYSAVSTNIPPTVIAIEPSAGATNVALNQPIVITFTKPMANDTTVGSWLTITANGSPVSFSSSNWSWNADKTVLTITLALSASTNYGVTVLASAAATDGTTFGANYPVAFTTGTQSSTTPPTASIDPLRNENGVETDITTDPTPTLTGIATDVTGSVVSNVEFRYAVSGNGWSSWLPAAALDGSFGSPVERFIFTVTPEVARGQQSVQVRTTNAAGAVTGSNFTTYNFYVIGDQPELTLKANGSAIVNGDPINPTPSFEVTVVTDRTLAQLWFYLNETRVDIKPANPSFVTTVNYNPTLTSGKYDVRVEAVDRDNFGNTRLSTKEAVDLLVQTGGDVTVYGTPLNYPNPFNAGTETTNISYVLSRNIDVTLQVHDLSGILIAKKNYASGTNGGRAGYNEVSWTGRSDAGDVLGNGIYIYFIIADGKVVAHGKLTVSKR